MKKLDVRLLRMIKHSKGQFVSVMAIVATALSIYVLFNMTSININTAAEDYYKKTNINDIQVQLIKMPKGALNELRTIEGIKEVQGRISFDVPLRVQNKDEKVTIRLISVPPEGEKINKLFQLSDHKIKIGSDNAVLLEQFAAARHIKPGDTITPYINGKLQTLAVSDIAASSEFIYLMENEQALLPAPEKFGVAYVSEAFAQSVYGFKGSYNEVLITLTDKTKIDDVIEKVEKKLDKYGVKRVTKLKDQLSNSVLTQKMDGINKMATVLPVMFLLVAAIIIVIMLSRIVSNDRMTIGVLKALGYSNGSILSHYTKYALAIGLAGSILGIIMGLFFSGPMTQMFISYFNIPFDKINIYAVYIINAIVLTSIFCIASGLLGARSILRIMPADSMRPEAPKTGKRILLERIQFIWKRLSFSWKMVIRNIMRTKRRFIFLVFGLALTYAINTVPLYESEAFSAMFMMQYGEYQKMDYTIKFSHPMNKDSINDLKHLVKAGKIEPQLEYPFELKNGWRKKNVNIIGIEKDTAFYQFKDSNDKSVAPDKSGILLTEGLAKALNLKKGDQVIIKSFLPGKEDVTLKVAGTIKQYLGSNAYMDIEVMQSLLMEKEMITGVTMASTDDVKEKLKDVKNISAVLSSVDMKNSFLELLDTMAAAIKMYMLLGGVLGFAIIYNATIIGISERNMEFASLRVMGFDKKDIFKMISKENFLMAGIAILLGVPLGMGMIGSMAQAFSTDMITLPVLYSPKIFINAALATAFYAIIAQLATRKKIYNLNFIDALKSRIS